MDRAETSLEELLGVVQLLRGIRCPFWLEGGWGVDAMVGRQTRPHRDIDVDIDAALEDEVLSALADRGYAVETDWRPNRVELRALGRGWVDVHPLIVDGVGNARQAALDGSWHEFPASFFTVGHLGGVAVPCVSVEAQRLFRSGYELRTVDHHDLALLDELRGP